MFSTLNHPPITDLCKRHCMNYVNFLKQKTKMLICRGRKGQRPNNYFEISTENKAGFYRKKNQQIVKQFLLVCIIRLCF